MKDILESVFLLLLSLAALLLLFVSFPLAAAEHITSLGSGTVHSGWTWDGTKYVASSAYGSSVDFSDVTIVAGHNYHYSISETRTSGTLRINLGAPKTAAPTGSNVATVDLNGAAPIADNFTTANGVGAGSTLGPDSSTDVTGAFRSRCGPSRYAKDDPIVYPGLPGRSHLHEFFGNDSVNAYSTERSLRLSGGSSCSSRSGPVYRSAFWQPAMFDGVGGVKRPIFTDVYYKQVAASNVVCQHAPDATHIGTCVGLPNHIRWVFGYSMSDGTGGPTDASQAALFHYVCDEANNEVAKAQAPSVYQTLKAMYDAGCRSPATIGVINSGPACWDGLHLDTPNHRSHVSDVNRDPAARVTVNFSANGTPSSDLWAPCPVDHPYVIPVPELHTFYVADAAWDAGKWRLSCDEQMAMAMDAGTCLHQDYWEAWSPSVKNTWVSLCINLHEHCSDGNLGDGTGINFGGANGMRNFSLFGLSQGAQIPLSKFGYSRYITATGTFTGEITPADSGNISIDALDGFTGNVTAFSITDVTANTAYNSTVTAHSTLASSSSAFDPASLFTGGKLGAWYDPSDITTLFKDSACSIPVTASGDAVGCMKDKSGLGYNLLQATSGKRPLYQTGSGLSWLLFDGVDDGLVSASGDTWAATSDVLMALRITSTQSVLMWDGTNSGGEFLGVVQQGTSSANNAEFGTPANFVNGTALSPDTRDGLYLALTGADKVYEAQGAAVAMSSVAVGDYAGFVTAGRCYGIIISDTANSAQRGNVRTWLGAKAGLTL